MRNAVGQVIVYGAPTDPQVSVDKVSKELNAPIPTKSARMKAARKLKAPTNTKVSEAKVSAAA